MKAPARHDDGAGAGGAVVDSRRGGPPPEAPRSAAPLEPPWTPNTQQLFILDRPTGASHFARQNTVRWKLLSSTIKLTAVVDHFKFISKKLVS